MIFHLTGSRWDHPSMMEIQWPTPQAQLPQEFLQMMNHPRNVVDDTVFVNPGFLCRSVRFSVRSGRKGGTLLVPQMLETLALNGLPIV